MAEESQKDRRRIERLWTIKVAAAAAVVVVVVVVDAAAEVVGKSCRIPRLPRKKGKN